jgi:hypothetical protein
MTDKEFQKLFFDVTGLTWDVKALIATATTDDAKKALLKKLVWLIPDGAAADLKDREALPTKTLRLQLVDEFASRLHTDLSQVFVDFNEDDDIDAYDAVTVDDSTDSGSDE